MTAAARTTKRDALIAVCTLARSRAAGACAWCGEDLPPRRRSWCSDRCGDAFWANHWWSVARRAAKRRDRYCCKRCGAAPPKRPVLSAYATRAKYLAAMRAWRKVKRTTRLEVNHIVPCRGKHAALDCAHHLDNLETLCPPCHKTHTAALVIRRVARTAFQTARSESRPAKSVRLPR
ncbi:MAG TPA: HNH endonuclease [Candidatus Limnocylindrales bacterium]|nr:HNH endonuclease [Candidatus Limnocylindrales bacterium]